MELTTGLSRPARRADDGAAQAPRADQRPASSFKVNVRFAHRAARDVVVGRGNASVRGAGLTPLPGPYAIEVLHFPIRGFDHFRRKFLDHYRTVGGRRGDHVRAHRAARSGTLRQLYQRTCVDEDQLERGLAAGSLAVDTRLRDALRALAGVAALEGLRGAERAVL